MPLQNSRQRACPECDHEESLFNRRSFLQASAGLGAALVTGAGARLAAAADAPPAAAAATSAAATKTPESVVKVLFESLSPKQREVLCFDWDHMDPDRGLLRTRVSNNWHITKPVINSEFFTGDQKQMVRDAWAGIIQPEWQPKVDKQLKDDAGGFGNQQNIAFFGKPGDKFEFVMTGRHMTLRCDGNTSDHVAFGGPIFYGHAASGFNEKPGHPGNVYWEQALAANKVHEMLDGKQREKACIGKMPGEGAVAFRTGGGYPGIQVADLSSDQKAEVQKVLQKLIEPYRQSDRDEVAACLKAQGGLDKCALSFYTDEDLGDDKVWDTWRLEGPAFVWHFRGTPHVHVWVNIADDPSVKLNA